MIDLPSLRALLAAATPLPWFDRGRHISRVPDNTGMGATLHTNLIAVIADQSDAALIAAAVNALPGLLDRIAELEAACARLEAAYDRLAMIGPPAFVGTVDELEAFLEASEPKP